MLVCTITQTLAGASVVAPKPPSQEPLVVPVTTTWSTVDDLRCSGRRVVAGDRIGRDSYSPAVLSPRPSRPHQRRPAGCGAAAARCRRRRRGSRYPTGRRTRGCRARAPGLPRGGAAHGNGASTQYPRRALRGQVAGEQRHAENADASGVGRGDGDRAAGCPRAGDANRQAAAESNASVVPSDVPPRTVDGDRGCAPGFGYAGINEACLAPSLVAALTCWYCR